MTARSQSAVDKATTSTISGKVTVAGKGLSGVVVGLVISDEYRSKFRPTRFRGTTDEDGNYRITNVPPGTYEVIPASPAYAPVEGRKSVIIGKNETVENIDISLQQGGVITGKVMDSEGRPVIEETVYVTPVKATRGRPYFPNIRTDDRGIYRAYGVPAGRYTVSAGRGSSGGSHRSSQRTYHPSAVDPAAAIVIDVNEGSETTNVDITLGGPEITYSARGRIIDSETNKPLPNTSVGVQAFFQHGTSARGNVTASNKDGEFRVANLAPGKYAVYSQPPDGADWHSEAVQFEVTDRDVDGLVIKTSRGGSISGVVILEGTDDPKLRASLIGSSIVAQILDSYLGRSAPSATINPNGSFRITGLAAGRLMLQIQRQEQFRLMRVERDGIVYQRGLEIKEHEHVTGLRVIVGHANAAIRGAIKLPNGVELTTPVAFRVIVRRTEDAVPGTYSPPVDADARGHFVIDRLVAGTYEIAVTVLMNAPSGQRPIMPPTRQTVIVTNGATTEVTITLQIPKPAPQ